MTKKFDDKARKELLEKFNINDYDFDNVDINKIVVKRITCKEARPYIATFHYSKTMPDSSKFIYAGFYENRIIGIIVFGMGTSKAQFTSVYPKIKQGEYCELTRLWVLNNMPKNTESKIISKALKLLPNEIKLVVSFADDSKKHVGTIYQATNWFYLGKNKGGKMLLCEDGITKHVRLIGMYRERHPELYRYTNEEIMKMNGWSYTESGSKHRYVFIRGNKKEKRLIVSFIKDRIMDYPKIGYFHKNNIGESEIIDMEKERVII